MTFKRISIASGVLFAALILLDLVVTPVPAVFFLLLALAYIAISFGMAFYIRSGFFMKVICRGDTGRPFISITFDDGPDPDTTPVILDILKRNGIKATFFCIGKKIRGNENLLQRIIREGHIIGMHSFSHANGFDFFSSGKMKEEFSMTSKIILEATGRSPLLFRPPYGVINPLVKKALRGTGLFVIGYSNRVYDTAVKDESKILERFRKKLKPGDIVILHDTIPATAGALQQLIDHTKASGYSVIPLDELVNVTAYER